MEKHQFKSIGYNATIFAKDLKIGMKLIDYVGVMPTNRRCEIFTVTRVVITKEQVIYRARTDDDGGYYDFAYEENRRFEEPKMRVFFSSIEEGLGYGIPKEDIEET